MASRGGEEDAAAGHLGREGKDGSSAGEIVGRGLGGRAVAEGGGVEDGFVVGCGCVEEDGGWVHGLEMGGGGTCAAGDEAFLDL